MRSMSKRMVAALFAILLVATSLQAQNIPAELIQYPEIIVHNGKIVTMSDATLNDSLGRTVQAMAVRNNRILAVGSNSEVLRLAGPQTRQIDLGGPHGGSRNDQSAHPRPHPGAGPLGRE